MQKQGVRKWVISLLKISLLLGCGIILMLCFLWQNKKNTCNNIWDVYEDIKIILTQRSHEGINIMHGMKTMGVYLTSNILDGTLYEWRLISETEVILEEIEIKHIEWEAAKRRFVAYNPGEKEASCVIHEKVHMFVKTVNPTIFHKDSPTLDYTDKANYIDIIGYVLCPKNENTMFGYCSDLKITYIEGDSKGSTIMDKEYKTKYAEAIENEEYSEGEMLEALVKNKGTYFEYSVHEYLCVAK